jgi:hypothetical protein
VKSFSQKQVNPPPPSEKEEDQMEGHQDLKSRLICASLTRGQAYKNQITNSAKPKDVFRELTCMASHHYCKQ